MNQPDRVAAWLVKSEEGQQAMEVTDDPKLANAIKVLLNAQDHTLGNMIRSQLLLDPCITFAGYRIPHPLTNQVELRIQTDPSHTPYTSPRKALLNACVQLNLLAVKLKRDFVEQAKAMEIGAGVGVGVGYGGYGGMQGQGAYGAGGGGGGVGLGAGGAYGGMGESQGMDYGYGGTQGGGEDPYQY